MLPDIFSSFDPISYTSFIPTTLMMVMITPILLICLMVQMHTHNNRSTSTMTDPFSVIMGQLSRTTSLYLKGLSSVIAALFMLIIFINLIGMAPYFFSLSSHLIITLSLGFPLWASMLISSFSHSPRQSMAHFLPDGAPDWLNPFLVMIESSSVMVRPLTLSFRLAANMTAGHIVLSLINFYATGAFLHLSSSAVILILLSAFYILFEFAICLIQAYIFCLLLSLYSDDHAHATPKL